MKSNPMDCSLPGSSIREIFQARVLEWGAIAFSSLSHLCNANIHLQHFYCLSVTFWWTEVLNLPWVPLTNLSLCDVVLYCLLETRHLWISYGCWWVIGIKGKHWRCLTKLKGVRTYSERQREEHHKDQQGRDLGSGSLQWSRTTLKGLQRSHMGKGMITPLFCMELLNMENV